MQAFIVKSPEHEADPVFVFPQNPFPAGIGLMVGEGNAAVFVKDGSIVGTLGPGRHALDPNQLPFMWNLRDANGRFQASIMFVSFAPLPARFATTTEVSGPGGQVAFQVFGTARYRIADPTRFVMASGLDPMTAVKSVLSGEQLKALLRTALAEALGAGWQPLQLCADPTRLAQRVRELAAAGDLAQLGVEVVDVSELNVSVPQATQPAAPAPVPRAEPVYEMLWNCRHCGATKLLGLSHRHCPQCGAPQNPAERYFPSDAEKVAVQDHVYYGADRICRYCQNGNGRNSKHCGTCGGPLEEGNDVQRRHDQVHALGAYGGESAEDARRELAGVAKPQPPLAPKKTSWGLILGGIAGMFVLAFLGLVVLALVWKKPAGLEVAAHEWKRDIDIERFGPVEESAWCDSLPPGASVKKRSRAVRSHEKIEKGEKCKTRKVDQGDGTFRESKECEPVYEDKPVYDDECRYTVDKWSKQRTLSAAGRSVSDAPQWPAVALERSGQCVGCEREGKRSESYIVRFVDPKSKDTSSCTFDQSKWRSFAAGSRWQGEVGVVGGILDCSSLKQR